MTAPARLTYAQAVQMTRGELISRLYEESQRWQARPPRGEAGRAAYAEYTRCLRLIDPHQVVSDALAWVKGGPHGSYHKSRPCDDNPDIPEGGRLIEMDTPGGRLRVIWSASPHATVAGQPVTMAVARAVISIGPVAARCDLCGPECVSCGPAAGHKMVLAGGGELLCWTHAIVRPGGVTG